ncbi:hypothetical protein CCP1ISM_2100003 [Azospirillaceae bacterium]
MQFNLLDFDKSVRDLKNYTFESPFIKFWDFGFNKTFESKERLSIKRKTKGKGKESKLVIIVEQEWACKEENEEVQFNGGGNVEFKTEEEAIEFFKSQVEEAKFFMEKNKENIVWDCQRYFLIINDKNEAIGRA